MASGERDTVQRAVAIRWVCAFRVTSTMRALPCASRWVSPSNAMGELYGRPFGAGPGQIRDAADAVNVKHEHVHGVSGPGPGPVGQDSQGVRNGHGQELVRVLASRRANMKVAPGVDPGNDSHEERLSVGLPWQVDVGDRRQSRLDQIGVPGHLPQCGSGEEVEGDRRGNRVAGKAKDREPPVDHAERERLGRPNRDLHPVHRGAAQFAQNDSNDVEIPDADPATRDQRIALFCRSLDDLSQDGRIVRDDAEVNDRVAGPLQERRQHRAVAIADGAPGEGPRTLPQFVTGRKDPDGRRTVDRHRVKTEPSQHPEVSRAERGTDRDDLASRGHVAAGSPHGGPRPDRLLDDHPSPIALGARPLDHAHRVGSIGEGGAGHDPDGLVDPHRDRTAVPGHDRIDHPEPGGRIDDVRRTQREAVHRRVGERRDVFVRHDGCCGDATRARRQAAWAPPP